MQDVSFEHGYGSVRDLSVGWLVRHGPTGVEADAEAAAWASLGREQRDLVLRRLEALTRLRVSGVRGEVERVARDLELGRANLYRLMKRMDEVGPVSGLIAHRRAKGVESTTRDGFGARWDEWIDLLLSERPDMAVPTLRARLAELAAADQVAEQPPEISALRRRVNRLRPDVVQVAETPVSPEMTLGLEEVGVSAGIRPSPDVDARVLRLMLLVDESKRLIIGRALFTEDLRAAVAECVASTDAGLRRLADAGAPMPATLTVLGWRVPETLMASAGWVGSTLRTDRRFEVILVPAFLFGTRTIRRLGDRFGELPLVGIRLSKDGSIRDGVADPAVTFETMAAAAFVVDREIDRWNAKVLRGLEKMPPTQRAASVERAAKLADDLRLAFLPVAEDWRDGTERLRSLLS